MERDRNWQDGNKERGRREKLFWDEAKRHFVWPQIRKAQGRLRQPSGITEGENKNYLKVLAVKRFSYQEFHVDYFGCRAERNETSNDDLELLRLIYICSRFSRGLWWR